MDWKRYKTLCDSPNVWSRWFVARLLDLQPGAATAVAEALAQILTGTPLPRPDDHRGGSATDMFVVSLDAAAVLQLLTSVRSAVESGVLPPALANRGLGGFTEALLEYQAYLARSVPAAAASAGTALDPPSTKKENPMGQAGETVLGMINAFNRNNLDDILSYFAEDAVYHNMPMEPLTGTAAIRAGLSAFLSDATTVEWVVLNLLEDAAGTVLTERLDKFQINGGWLELPVMGTFEVRNGRIQAWRDYFDLGDFQRQMAAVQSSP